MHLKHDVLIVGAGLAGLRAAVELPQDVDAAVLSKVYPTRSHSGAAQGGIAAALANEGPDSWEWHMYDTVKGGDFLTDQDAAEVLASDAPRAIYELEHLGVPFNRTPEGRIAQRAFGGHTRDFGAAPVKRACHAADRTGRVVLDTLYGAALRKGVKVYPEYQAVDLFLEEGRAAGLAALELATGDLHVIEARAILFATGGFGKIYKTSSNCFANTGDGVYLAYRAGIPLQDMEFVQFHPTGIAGLGVLISEAARGEGGILRNGSGERFMERYAPVLKDLAPRDLASRAIAKEILDGRGIGGGDFVHLDLTGLGQDRLSKKLSEISSFVRIYLGLDPVRDPIPVQPTCHYMMGGIPTNLDGQVLDAETRVVPGLYAAGECACVSVHGANRLGCNSLLDLVVFGRRVGIRMAEDVRALPPSALKVGSEGRIRQKLQRLMTSGSGEKASVLRREMQEAMAEHCAVFRTEEGLHQALDVLGSLIVRSERVGIQDRGRRFNTDLTEVLELESLLRLAEAVAFSARARKESRGAHFREDYQERNDNQWLSHTLVLMTTEGPRLTYKPVKITRFEPRPRTY